MRGWKGEPIGGAGWPPQPALGAAYTDTRRFGAEVPTASPVHKHLLTSSGGRSRLGAETACSMAGWPRAETPRPTARRFHSLQTQQPFPVPDRISGPESPRARSSVASSFTEAGEYVCARARARAEGVRGVRTRPCRRSAWAARAPV